MHELDLLLKEIRKCTICKEHLPLGPNPVVNASLTSKIAIIGQTPGTRVHKTGIPWNDPSGDQLRKWLDVTDRQFYDAPNFSIVPMAFCYPGKGASGDLPPRPECAPEWHSKLFNHQDELELILLIGQYAQKYYLGKKMGKNLTETVQNYESYLPRYLPLPHPSPRNRFWLKKNPWFDELVVPKLQEEVKRLLTDG